jgi:AcrR family transcriptional regulator
MSTNFLPTLPIFKVDQYNDAMSDTVTRGRGRPRTFDEEAVLDALTLLFWEHGYEATSMADIADAARLNKSSLYNTFGSKQELFDRVLDRYVATRTARLMDMVSAVGGGIDALHAFAEVIRAETQSDMGASGCLAINASAELGGSDTDMAQMAVRYRARIREALTSLLQGAADVGDIDPDAVEHHVALLLAFMLGVSVTARSGASQDEIGALIDGVHATIDSWAVRS